MNIVFIKLMMYLPWFYLDGFVPTLYSYANLIKAYAYHRRIDDVFEVFNKLKIRNLIPNQVRELFNIMWNRRRNHVLILM